MEEIVTKDDLRQFGLQLLDRIRVVIKETTSSQTKLLNPEWLKSKVVRKMMR